MLHEQKFQVITMMMIPLLLWFGWCTIYKKETKNIVGQAASVFVMATLCIVVMLAWCVF